MPGVGRTRGKLRNLALSFGERATVRTFALKSGVRHLVFRPWQPKSGPRDRFFRPWQPKPDTRHLFFLPASLEMKKIFSK